MSHRGRQATSEDQWRNAQRRAGYADGKAGVPQRYADEHYLRGYRQGRRNAEFLRVNRGDAAEWRRDQGIPS